MSGGGIGVTVGSRMQSVDSQGQSTTAAGSTIGSTGGNVTINAGKTYTQTGSDVLTPAGDIAITAKAVDINEARETGSQSSEQKFKQSGVTVAVTSGLVSNLQMADSQIKAAGNTSSDRMKALAAVNAAAGVVQAAQNATQLNVSITAGSSSSQSQQQSSADTAKGSNLNAGGNVSITATGAGKDSDITVRGSNIEAGKATSLKADDQVSLLAAANTTQESNSSKNSSASAGVSAGTGGVGFIASASAGKGNGSGNSTTYTNTQVSGNTVNIDSGGDTTLKGAVVKGDQVTANVGGKLQIESLQDRSTYQEKNSQAGGSVFVGAGASGPVSGNVNLAQTRINSDYTSVNEQSAIRAGDGGFNVKVQDKTELTGGQITSTQAAVDNNKNSYEAKEGTTTTDLQNSANYKASSVSVSVGVGSVPGQSASAGMSGVGFGSDKGSAQSTTTAGISGITGNTSARTGDKSTSIAPIFDKDKTQKEVAAQVAITSEFGKQASKAVGDYAQKQYDKALAEKDQAGIDAWKEGGSSRVTLHAVVGGLTGGAAGAVGSGAASAAAPALDELQGQLQQGLQKAGVGDDASKLIASLASGATAAGIGAAASGGSVAGGATAFNADMNNRQLSFAERQKAAQLAQQSGGKYTQKQIEDAMRSSPNKNTGETTTTGMVVSTTDKDGVYDKGAVFNAGAQGTNTIVQQLPNDGKVDATLADYIKAGTGGANSPYEWSDAQQGKTQSPTVNPNTGLNTITPAANGAVTAEAAAGLSPVRNPIKDGDDIRQDTANTAALVGRGAGIVSNAATAAAAVPGPHQPVAAGVAVTATGVDFVSKVVEQIASPDKGKLLIESGIDIATKPIADKFPIISPVVNEAAEILKNIDPVKNAKETVGK